MIIKPKGTRDFFGLDAIKFTFLEKLLFDKSFQYSFERIIFPTFEYKELFVKSAGDSSDIVQKEIYSFQDKNNRELALRPEGTASTVRLTLENNLINRNELQKYFYFASMYRYERPQKGRQREFWQYGVEIFNDSSDAGTIELIIFAKEILDKLNIKFKLLINSIGGLQTRANYNDKLKQFLEPHYQNLSEDSKVRFSQNILRILDSKDSKDQNILINSPKISEYLNEKETKSFSKIKELLTLNKIEFEIDNSLVRGLDYYNDLIFEFVSYSTNLTLIGGGRYDGLVNNFDSKLNLPAVGFAIGIERLLDLLPNELLFENKNRIYIGSLIEENENVILAYAAYYRNQNYHVKTNFNIKKYDFFVKNAKLEGYNNLLILDKNYIIEKKALLIDLETNQKKTIKI